MVQSTFRRSALAGLALLAVGSTPTLAQQPGGTPNADWHRTVDDALGKPGTEQPGGV